MQRHGRLFLLAILILLLGLASAQAAQPAAAAQSATAPGHAALPAGQFKVWLQAPRAMAPRYRGTAAATQALNVGAATPLALAAGDFDADGVQDLVVGYATGSGGALAIYRGNLDAFAPQSQASFEAIAHGQFPDPFLRTASVMDVPATPDFLATGDFNGDGDLDIVVGSRASSTLLILFGDGHGQFTQPYALSLPGPVTALAAERLLTGTSLSNIMVGTASGNKGALLVFSGTHQLLSFPMPGAVTSVAFGNLYRGSAPDTAIVAGGQVLILRGNELRGAAAGNFNFHLASVGLPQNAVSVEVGSFLFDRTLRQQMAVMSSDGSVSIVAPAGLDPTPLTMEEARARRRAAVLHQPMPVPAINPNDGWMIAETFPAVGGVGATPPIMMRTQISNHGGHDIAVLDGTTGQLHVLAHDQASVQGGVVQATAPLRGEMGLASSSAPVAAFPMRVNVDGRSGLVVLNEGQVAPSVIMPTPDPTFFVNTDTDPTPTSPIANACNNTSFTDLSSSCSLREAVLKANGDTIMLQAGHTYSLTIGRGATQDYTGNTGTLYINNTATIVGGNQNTTIVQWGTPGSGTVDMVMAVNEDLGASLTNATASVSNLTLQNGVNHGTSGGFDGDGGCMEFDTGGLGASNLTLTNVTMQNCSTTDGGGGGLVTFAAEHPAGGGTVSISNSVFQSNSVAKINAGAEGGGIAISAGSLVTITSSQVMNNNAILVGGGQAGQGGGFALDASGATAPFFGTTTIHASTISGNQAAGLGGGLSDAGMSLAVDQGTVISGNKSGLGNVVNAQNGGGVYINTFASGCPGSCPNTVSFNKVAITGNTTTGNGGGIHTGNASAFPSAGPLSINFSRLAGNTASGSGSNLSNNGTTVTATNNWWGTDAAATTISTINSGVTTFDPFIVLTHTSSPTKIRINQSSTLTADMSLDNHGNGAALSGNLDEIVGRPVTFANAFLGTIPQAQPETLGNPVPTATATFNAGGTGGDGSANATVDQALVPVNSNLIASATESGTTATITTVGAHNFAAGNVVTISGAGGYNGTFTITGVTPPTQFSYTANSSGLGTITTGSASIFLVILQPPSMTKSFSPKTIQTTAGTGTTVSTITFAITNGNVVPINISFTDNLPTNVGTVPGSLVVASTPNVVNPCGGTVTATAGSGTISYSNNTFAVGGCSIKVDVQSAVDNIYSNSVTVDSTDAGNGNTSSDTLNVINPPSIAKAFGAATIPLNGTTSLTFTVSSNNQNQTLGGIAFTDSLPAGLVVATPNNLNTTCTGTATGTAGSGTVSLSGASLAPGASCTVSVNAQGTTAGVKNNSVTVSDTTAGTGNTSNASITVVAPPTISKAFGAASIPLNGTTTLVFTITNPNTATTLNGIAFSDTVPANLKMIGFGSAGDTCNGVTSPGSSTVNYSGISQAANSSCTLTVTVKGIAAGDALNTTSAITSTEGGTGTTSNTATLTVVAPPTISKAFGAASIPVNGTTTVTFTLTNPAANTTAENGVAFSDTLTGGLQVASTPGVSNTCGGTVTAASNSTSISLSGGSIATPGTSCTIVVNVTGTQSGIVSNTTGGVSSTNGGTGATSNTATLTVASPPTIAKAFGAATLPLNATTSLTFSINNPNTGVALTGVAFTDTLPAGLVVATPPNVTGSCGSGTITATVGGGTINLSGGTLAAAGSCTFSVDVTGTTAGIKANTTGAITSTEGGTGTTSNTATITVTPASTSTGVVSSANPSVFGQPVTFTATVTNTSAGSTGAPTGSVQFVVDGVNFGSPVALAPASSTTSTATSAAIATLSVAGSPHTVSADYTNADGNFTNSSGSLAGGQTITLASTNTAVVSSSNPSVFGESVAFTATVTDTSAGSTAQPTGSVQFVVDGVNFGAPVTLTGASSNSSTATSPVTATLTIAGSPHTVTANYINADGDFSNSSGSLAGGQVVTPANTTTTVGSSAGTITLGDTVTFTATVAVNTPGTGTPTGLVTFFDGSTPIGTGTLNGSAQATFSTALLAVGSHSITAIYGGDASFTASPLSSPTTETVNLRGTTTGVALNPTTVAAGQASTITATITDAGASTPPGTPDVFTATGAPATGRTGFTSTLFADGMVLVAGGTGSDGTTVLNSAEIYSVSGAAFTATGNLNTARTGAVAVLLPNGKVLVAGGSSDGTANGALNSAELFDPVAGTFTPSSHNLTAARFGATITLLNTGKVLLAGGENSGGVLNTAELYDPATDTFTATGNLNAARTGASATLLGTGKVLVAGGSSNGAVGGALSSADVFDPAGNAGAGTFASVAGANPTLAVGRWQPEAALLLSGKVLVAGGQNAGGVLTSADLYDPAADSFTASAHLMNDARANGPAVALPNGMVLLPGGTTSQAVELYDADSDDFNLTGSLLHHLSDSAATPAAATLLNNGQVLVVGINIDNAPTLVSDAELYSPSFNPLGTVGFGSSEPTDVFGAACVLVPSTGAASTCTSSVTPVQVATSPHTITGTYPADAVHSGSNNSASLTVVPTAAPTIAKSFSASNVGQNSTVNVSFTIVNPNPAATLTGVSFTDALPAGLVVATPNNLFSNCGGTVTAVSGSSSISLTGGTLPPADPNIPASGQCVITVDLLVTGTGTLSNTTGPVSANESGPGNPSNTATISVVLAPTFNKAFGAASIPVNGTTSLTFNIANPNTATTLVGIALSDTLPSGLVVANPNGLTGSCVASSVISANPGSNSISLFALNLPASGSCSFSVNVTGTSGGTKNNTTAPITGTFDDGSGLLRVVTGGSASASIVVVAPPVIAKAFVPADIPPGSVSTLTFTVTNPAANSVAETGVAFTDTLPANIVIATPNGLSGSCGGTVTATSGTGTVSLAGGSVAAASSCVFSVNVTGSTPGTYVNTTGAVSSTNGGTGNTASATLSVGLPPTITKAFGAAGIPLMGSTTLRFTLNNPNTFALTGVAFSDTLPAGLVVSTPNGLTSTCGGTVTAGAGSGSVSLAGGNLPGSGSCVITVSVTGTTTGTKSNTTGPISSNETGPGAASNTATLLVSDFTISATPASQTVTAGNSTTYTVTVTPNPAPFPASVNMTVTGLPFGATALLNPDPITGPIATATNSTLTIFTTSRTALLTRPESPFAPRSGGELAMTVSLGSFGFLGLVFVGLGDGKRRRRRLAWVLLALVLLGVVAAGCGGKIFPGPPPVNGTPPGTYTITITGTSGGLTHSTTVTLVVN